MRITDSKLTSVGLFPALSPQSAAGKISGTTPAIPIFRHFSVTREGIFSVRLPGEEKPFPGPSDGSILGMASAAVVPIVHRRDTRLSI
ncbi:MAG: hypothetical protein WDN48_07875 [Pseudolabrys sp.]